jgi:hypothetical protein
MKSCLLRKLTPASNSRGARLTYPNRIRIATVIRCTCISVRAKTSPMQFLGPAENGSMVAERLSRTSVDWKRSGWKESGSTYKSGCR